MRPTQADRAETTGVARVVRTGLLFRACLKARRRLAGTAVSSAIPRSLRGRSAVPVSPRQLAADRPRPRLPARQRWADFPLPREGRRGLTAPAAPGEGWPCSEVRRPL